MAYSNYIQTLSYFDSLIIIIIIIIIIITIVKLIFFRTETNNDLFLHENFVS